MRLHTVEGFEELRDGALVGFLRGGEAGLVDAVVDVVVRPCVRLFYLFLQVFGEEHDVAVLLREEVVEFGVEHADDFRAFVGDDRLVLFVVKRGHGEAARVVRVHTEVNVSKMCEVWVQGVGRDVLSRKFFI